MTKLSHRKFKYDTSKAYHLVIFIRVGIGPIKKSYESNGEAEFVFRTPLSTFVVEEDPKTFMRFNLGASQTQEMGKSGNLGL